MRKIAWVLCLAMLLTLLPACSDEQPVPTGMLSEEATQPTQSPEINAPGALETEDDVFTLAYFAEQGFNPYTCNSINNRMLFSLIYQGLFALDRDSNAVPILCKSFTVTDDLKTYTFRLESATFSDGSYLMAEDVVASLNAAKESDMYAGRFDRIKEIEVVGDRSVRIVVNSAYENLPMLLDIPIVKASEVGAASPLGTGPYRLDGDQLRRQFAWWCSAQLPVTLLTIPLVAATDEVHIRNSFESGSVGLVCADPGSKDYVDFRNDCELWDSENGLFVYMTTNKKSKIFENEAIRKALTHAIDRDALVNTYYRGFARGATLPASPDFPYYNSKLAANYGYDPQKFADAVAGAQLQSNAVTILVSTSDYYKRYVANAVADALRKAGLSVTMKEVSAANLVSELRWGTWDLFVGQTRLSANMDLSAFFVSGGALNYGNLTDDAIYAMCKDSLANTGNYYDLHKLVMESGRLCPILFQSCAIYGKRGVAPELSPARDNLFYYHLGRTLEDARVSA